MKNQQEQTPLFEDLEQDKPRKTTYAYLPAKLGNYDKYEVISAFRKSMKLGLIDDSFYWLTLMLRFGRRGARGMIMRQCWIVINEDCFDTKELVNYCSSIVLMEKEFYINETDCFYQLVWQICKATKWWESELGREWDESWAKSEGEVTKNNKPIPKYAIDVHTLEGKTRYKEGLTISDQYSGTEIGRQKTRYIYERDGELGVDADIDSDFWSYWKKYHLKLKGLET